MGRAIISTTRTGALREPATADLLRRGDGSGTVPQDVLDAYSMSEANLFIAGVSQTLYFDALVGEVFHAILKDQFYRLRAGDRFWYERPGLFDHTAP